MFWDNIQIEPNTLVQLLNSKNFTFDSILEDPYILQEVRCGNKDLLDFFSQDDNIIELINSTLKPKIDPCVPLKLQYKRAHICCEILTAQNIEQIYSSIFTNPNAKQALLDFFDDESQVNHLVAGFYTKIIENLLLRELKKTLEVLKVSSFLKKSLDNVHLGAIEELLENVIKIPMTLEGTDALKQWLNDESFIQKLIDLISPKSNDDVNENASDVFIEIVKELRDKLYSLDNRDDQLHDTCQSVEVIQKLVEKLIAQDEGSELNSSPVKASAKAIEMLIQTNFILNTPSHLIELEHSQELDDRGDNFRSRCREEVNTHDFKPYRPDVERVVEKAVSTHSTKILRMVIDDLKKNDASLWRPLLSLFVSICDTNYIPTHESVLQAFSAIPFQKLVDTVHIKPTCTILHNSIHKILMYALYTKDEDGQPSPLIHYFLSTSGLLENIDNCLRPEAFNGKSRIESSSIRTFFVNMAVGISKARKNSPSSSLIDQILQTSTAWPNLQSRVDDYFAKNKVTLSPGFSQMGRDLESHGFEIDEKEMLEESFNERIEDSANSIFSKNFADFETKFDSNSEDFETLCNSRNSSNMDNIFNSLGKDTKPASNDWPGETKTQMLFSTSGSHDFKKAGDDDWMRPRAPPVSGEPQQDAKRGGKATIYVPDDDDVNDCDRIRFDGFEDSAKALGMFGKIKSEVGNIFPNVAESDATAFDPRATAESSKSDTAIGKGAETWPGSENQETNDWPMEDAQASKSDPAMSGPAKTVSSPKVADESHA